MPSRSHGLVSVQHTETLDTRIAPSAQGQESPSMYFVDRKMPALCLASRPINPMQKQRRRLQLDAHEQYQAHSSSCTPTAGLLASAPTPLGSFIRVQRSFPIPGSSIIRDLLAGNRPERKHQSESDCCHSVRKVTARESRVAGFRSPRSQHRIDWRWRKGGGWEGLET
jgi:hypothetical protein